jgi:ribosomal protein S18 acetylase RimI-like enzyme
MVSGDEATVSLLMKAGFGWESEGPEVSAEAGGTERHRVETLIVDLDGATVGSLRLTRDDDTAGVYGFVVHPDHQGQGIGRDVLRRVCVEALNSGAARVHLEVAVDNDRALGLYTSLGFVPVATEDYYALPV